MSRKSKIDPALKVQLVEQFLRDEIGIREAGRLAGLSGNGTDAFREWVIIYKNEGPGGLLNQARNKHYPLELKLNAVNDYLQGEGSQLEIMGRYGIRSKKAFQDWIKQYNTHGEISVRTSGGGSYMSKSRQTTPEERLEIVQDCLANDRNYGAMALKYNCSYQQVRNWVLRCRYATGYCAMKRWAQPVWKTGVEGAQAHSLRGHLKKNCGIRLRNWSVGTAIFRWRMIC